MLRFRFVLESVKFKIELKEFWTFLIFGLLICDVIMDMIVIAFISFIVSDADDLSSSLFNLVSMMA